MAVFFKIFQRLPVALKPPRQPREYRTSSNDRRKYGYFKCPSCGRGWESAYAWRNYGKKCQACSGKFVKPHTVEALRCPKCGSSDGCKCESRRPDPKKPHDSRRDCRMSSNDHQKFGYFKCPSCGRGWKSAYAWENYGQKCRPCSGDFVKPFRVEPLRCSRCGLKLFGKCKCERDKAGSPKPHDSERCERCIQVLPCGGRQNTAAALH